MNFSDFVTFYWNKPRRSGAPWTPADIVIDSGLDLNVVNLYLDWLNTNAVGLTDAQAIAKFDAGFFLNRTPYGPQIGVKPGASVGPANFANFLLDLKALIARYGG